MGYTGFDTQFYIRRKRYLYLLQFLMYLEGVNSASGSWPDSEDTAIDPTTSGTTLAPFGYLFDGSASYLSGNLGVNGDTITQFTIGAVVQRNLSSNNDAVVFGLFGSTYYPRIYFVGTTLHAEIKLDGSVISLTVSNSDTYIKNGQPHLIVLRGSVASGVDLLIDETVRATNATTGTSFDVGTGDFKIGEDTNLSYKMAGAIRRVFALATKLTDTQIALVYAMLGYEGDLDVWHDDFSKWSGSTTFAGGVNAVSGSAYQSTIVES